MVDVASIGDELRTNFLSLKSDVIIFDGNAVKGKSKTVEK